MSRCMSAVRQRGTATATMIGWMAAIIMMMAGAVAAASADPAACAPPSLSAHAVASRTGASFPLGATLSVSCERGFTLVRSSRPAAELAAAAPAAAAAAAAAASAAPLSVDVSCLSSGQGASPSWSIPPQTLQCVAARCAPIQLADPNLSVDNAAGLHGDLRKFSCAPTLTMEGLPEVRCDAGRWRPSEQPTCFRNHCDHWDTPTNGRAWIAQTNATATATPAAAGAKAPATATAPISAPVRTLNFACDLGYKLVGSSHSFCQANRRWSSVAPSCRPFGLRAYPGRAGSFSAGALSIDNAFVLQGVLESARRTPNCIGVTITRSGGGLASAALLHADESFLVRRAGSDTYLLGGGGKAELHRGFASVKRARMGPLHFASDAHVLSGVRNAVRQLRSAASAAAQPDLVGFSVATGQHFAVQLLHWDGLPLRKDAGFNSFVLSAVERRVTEQACVLADSHGNGPLRQAQLLSGSGPRASRLACAAAARMAGHRHFALSHGKCYSGNEDISSGGQFVAAPAGSCGGRFAAPGSAAVQSSRRSGGVEGAFHLFALDASLLSRGVGAAGALVRNGGFDGNFTFGPGRNHAVLRAGQLPGWSVAGRLGVARAASHYSNDERSVPDGATLLWLEHGAEVRQQLTGLTAGRRYRLRFFESFRTPQGAGGAASGSASAAAQQYRAGARLSVLVGRRLVYANAHVHVPLWQAQSVTFRATASSAELRFAVDASELRRQVEAEAEEGKGKSAVAFAAVLLDGVRVERASLRARRSRSPGAAGRGVLREVSASDPAILSALLESVARLPAVVGFSLEKGARVRLLSAAHVAAGAALLPDAHASIHLSNGTVVAGHRCALGGAGLLSFRSAAPLHRALRALARRVANSVGYTLAAGESFRAAVLSAQALPLLPDAESDSFLFAGEAEQPRAMGCWALPAGGAGAGADASASASLLPQLHQLAGGVSRDACALAASRAGHRFFALQRRQCVSGSDGDAWRLGGPSARCGLRCLNGRDVCGGEAAGMVFQLPRHTRVSGAAAAWAEARPALAEEEQQRAGTIWTQPGTVDFSSAAAAAPSPADAALLAAEAPLSDGSRVSFRHSLVYAFPSSQRQIVTVYRVRAPLSPSLLPLAPRSWALEGSADGRSWVRLDEQLGRQWARPGQRRTFRLHNRAPFHFHRLVVTQNNAGGAPLGFALSGVELQAEEARAVQLVARWNFESAAAGALGFDSSARANDLQVLGDATAVGVVRRAGQAAVGEGYLSLRGAAGEQAPPTYLAVDAAHSAPSGLPAGDDSFSVAFWFHVSSADAAPRDSDAAAPMAVVSWGEASGAAANSVQLAPGMDSVVATFGVPGDQDAGRLASPFTGQRLTDSWRHVAVTFDSSTGLQSLYLDGTEAASRAVSDPSLRVAASRFRIGVAHASGALRDQFRGRLDDVAIFRGALSPAQVGEIFAGDFRTHLPLECQQLSDRFGIASQTSWGRAPDSAKRQYIRAQCTSVPSDCAALSDVHDLSPGALASNAGDFYMAAAYARQHCATWPSFHVAEGKEAAGKAAATRCPGTQTLRLGVLSQTEARRVCMDQIQPACVAFVWSAAARQETDPSGAVVAFQPHTISMCDAPLEEEEEEEQTEKAAAGRAAAAAAAAASASLDGGLLIARRLRPYYIEPDTSNRCDEEVGEVLANVASSQAARLACDRTAGCTGYIWTGPIGLGRSASGAPTPFMAMLCRGYRRHHPVDVAGSGYETGAVVGDYQTAGARYGRCSSVSEIGVRYDVSSSLEARRHCDRFDGRRGPRCLSFVWNRQAGEVHLCSGVPQEAEMQALEGVETAWLRPQSCAEISNRFGVRFNQTWGSAPTPVRRLYVGMGCSTSPTPCDQLSQFYGLSPSISLQSASRVPGSIRDLWLSQQCTSRPVGVALDRHKPQYQRVAAGVDSIEQRLRQVEAVLERAERRQGKQTQRQQAALQRQVEAARKKLEESIKQAKRA